MTAFADVLRPSGKAPAYTYDVLCVMAGSLFIALMSQISIPLWFTPVPITMQSFAVLLVAALLGSKRGVFSVLAYLSEGALGLPVFACGKAGVACLMGPTGGYLLGFVLCAFIVGYLLEKGWKNHFLSSLAALTLGSLALLALGTVWLSFYVGEKNAFTLGVYPFLIGDMLKIGASAAIIPFGWKFLK